jgi:protein-S-isoprenylcysteine O-methyltransferase Ste14
MTRLVARLVLAIAGLVGGVSLLGFAVFLFAGSIGWIDLGLDGVWILVFDGLLCLGFFIVHSSMIRKSFRRGLADFMPEYYHGAFYTLMSGAVLIVMLLFWQESGTKWVSIQGGLRVLTRGFFVAAAIGFWWGVRALPSFDGLGLKSLRAHIRGKARKTGRFAIRGPYRWVRHPLYFSVLVMIWSFPDLTADRILFNVSWTSWIVVGTYLEERDLVAEFGDVYRDYQRRAPMLVPVGAPVPKEDASPSNPDTD